ncbi:HD domain-containing protein [Rugamonas sp. DEMB1]|uniref:HD domain-containing protein n=1 Tax=Rugamonas sp. DEMB1 TaxID=3039386 RepID=UPI002449E7AA|nr:HD domain-containing protein [Rugamonas sp. DEMB1]WGG52804.1 HD domain-containing protein [Rugamonas sp. DEMB1]
MAQMHENLKFRYTLEDVVDMFVDDIIPAICVTDAFQRLKGISFLGAVERTKKHSGLRHNRFNHSIGVALLAQRYALTMEFSQAERIRVVVAALLHDIGHAPLSHSIEPLFAEKFGLNHHIATEKILQGKIALGRNLYEELLKNSLDIDFLINLMSGEDKSKFGRIFSSPINVDTIEAIWRGGSYVRKQFFNPVEVLDAFIAGNFSSGSVVDRFWNEKNSFYSLMIYSKEGVAADYWARVRVWESDKKLVPDDFYLTEKHFLSKYPADFSDKIQPTLVDIKVRNFEVDDSVDVPCYDALSTRYKIVKSKRSVLLDPPAKKEENHIQPSFFET